MARLAVFIACLGQLCVSEALAAEPRVNLTLTVRLVGGRHRYEGRVEVFYQGIWGAVCDHKWGRPAAMVVCRMLGYPDVVRFTTRTKFGRADAKIWLDDVICNGNEASLAECSHRDWGRYNCQREDVAGVMCKPHEGDRKLVPRPSVASGNTTSIRVRLVGRVVDSYISEGVAKVQLDGEGPWGNICSESWSYQNARVLCGQLGFPGADANGIKRKALQGKTKKVFLMSGVRCDGTESSLVSCDHAGWGRLECATGRPVVVTCIRANYSERTDVRLRSGVQISEGRVELLYQGPANQIRYRKVWGTVCDEGWDLLDANVVCRSLGYGTAYEALWGAYFGQGAEMVVMSNVRCTGREKKFSNCAFSQPRNCEHYHDAAVRCNAPQLQGHKIRLRGGQNPREGRVEIFHGGQWGAVCGDSWGLEEAVVVCRQLGLGYAKHAFNYTKFRAMPSNRAIIMSGVNCHLKQVSLLDCRHDGWNKSKCIIRERVAGVECADAGHNSGLYSFNSCISNGSNVDHNALQSWHAAMYKFVTSMVRCGLALPDLVINMEILRNSRNFRGRRRSIILDRVLLSLKNCAYEEGCFTSSADMKTARRWPYYVTRRLLTFTLQAENRGGVDFIPNVPRDGWQWHSCHSHFHSMEVFAKYDVLDDDGDPIAQGHKASFCLEDTKCDDGIARKWNCTGGQPQGISPNCYDIYKRNIDCQWVDLSDIRHGYYFLRIHLNPESKVAETDYENNVGICEIYDYGEVATVGHCHQDQCESGLRTHGGNAQGACCVFPFLFNGKWYHTCTKAGYYKYWCAATPPYVVYNRKWGLC